MSRCAVQITRHDDAGQASITVAGELDTTSAPGFAHQLGRVLQHCPSSVELDLQHVGFIDARGYRVLLRARRALRSRGGELSITSASQPVTRVLDALGWAKEVHS